MKKYIRLAIMLLLTMCFVQGMSYTSLSASASSIYFAEKYANKKGKVDMQKYSSPERDAHGLNVGYIKFYGFKDKKKSTTMQLYKESKNHYVSRDGNTTIVVKKKSIVVDGFVVKR